MTFTKTHKMALGLLASTAFATTAIAGSGHYQPYTPDLLPANPQTGNCYARVKIPAQYQTITKDVMVEEGYSTVDVTQPQISTRQQDVMVKEASVEYRVRQPRYTTVSEQVMVRPAYEKLSVSKPQFSSVTESIQISQPRLVWKKGNPGQLQRDGYKIHSTADAGYSGRGYSSTVEYGAAHLEGAMACGETCEIWCLVEEPGASVSYNRKVMTSPGQVNRVPVSAKYQTITKQVVADPGGVEEVPVPAQYRSITIEDVIPGSAHETSVPPKYAQVAGEVPMSAERYEWRQVVCKPGTGSIGGYVSPPYSGASSSSSSYSSGSSSYGSASSYGSGTTYSSYGSGGSYSSGSSISSGSSSQSTGSKSLGTYYYGSDLSTTGSHGYGTTHGSSSFGNSYKSLSDYGSTGHSTSKRLKKRHKH